MGSLSHKAGVQQLPRLVALGVSVPDTDSKCIDMQTGPSLGKRRLGAKTALLSGQKGSSDFQKTHFSSKTL